MQYLNSKSKSIRREFYLALRIQLAYFPLENMKPSALHVSRFALFPFNTM